MASESADCDASREKESGVDENGKSSANSFECAICLQSFSLPVEIPCGHSFCFLCIKGVCSRNPRCPLCRQLIPSEYFYEPKVLADLDGTEKSKEACSSVDGAQNGRVDNLLKDKTKKETGTPSIAASYVWLYEGRNGWWRYDDRTSNVLEEAYKGNSGDGSIEIMISGYVYVVDFRSMVQCRKEEPGRRRSIKREFQLDGCISDGIIKGIAGLKLPNASASD